MAYKWFCAYTLLKPCAPVDFNVDLTNNKVSKIILATLKLLNSSIFNHGDINLSPSEKIVLGLGLKFLPNTQLDITSIRDTLTHSFEKSMLRIRTNINYKDRPFTPSNIHKLHLNIYKRDSRGDIVPSKNLSL